MQQALFQSVQISPAVAAFWRRNTRGGEKKTNINLRDIPEEKQRIKRKRPKLSRKNKGGAPRGNSNALATGLYTKEYRATRLKVREMVAKLKLAAALVKAEAARMDADTTIRLHQAGLSRRALWPSEN
ncbi:MAG: hypothetical protein JSR55_00575 [Proteobacteria bacterium]|nr:hypothetical protein [Pseudomonadota bacterium]